MIELIIVLTTSIVNNHANLIDDGDDWYPWMPRSIVDQEVTETHVWRRGLLAISIADTSNRAATT